MFLCMETLYIYMLIKEAKLWYLNYFIDKFISEMFWDCINTFCLCTKDQVEKSSKLQTVFGMVRHNEDRNKADLLSVCLKTTFVIKLLLQCGYLDGDLGIYKQMFKTFLYENLNFSNIFFNYLKIRKLFGKF